MVCPTISERYERLKREAELQRAVPLSFAGASLAGASRFSAGSRVRYNASAHNEWKAHDLIGIVLGVHYKPEYKDRHLYIPADWLIRVDWIDGIGEAHVHPDWLEVVEK